MYKPEYLTRWTRERDYGGDDLTEWYILIGQTRDSYLMERENFKAVQDHIKFMGFEIVGNMDDCKADNAFLLGSFGHWACGWFELILIHESNDKGLELADEIKARLNDYPLFDEDSYYEAERELIENDVKEYIVKPYLDDNNIEYTNETLESISYALQNEYDFYLNGYDEVLSSGDDSIVESLERLTEWEIHLTECHQCHDKINNQCESCSCQLRLL